MKKKIDNILPSKTQSFKADNKYVGAPIARELADKLSLYCVIEGTSRAAVVRQVLTEFINDQESTKSMVAKLTKKMQTFWNDLVVSKKGRFKDKYWSLFRFQMKDEFNKKKLPDNIINDVIDNVKHD